MKRTDRYKFLKSLLILTVIGAVIIACVSLLYMPHLRSQSLSKLMHHKTIQSLDRFTAFILPVVTNLQVLRAWGEQGLLDMHDAKQLEKICIPLLETHLPHVSGLMMADTEGNVISILKRKGKWTAIPPDESYNPADSPWFQGAINVVEGDEIFWTSVYAFPGIDMPGTTASIGYRATGNRENTVVIALKIALKEVEGLVKQMPLGKEGRFLLLDDDFVRDFTRIDADRWQEGDRSALTSLDLLKEPDIAGGLTAWQQNGSATGTPLSFRSRNRTWWIEVNRVAPANTDPARIAVLLPDSQLQAETSRFSYRLLLGAMVILIMALVFVLLLLRRYGRETEAILKKQNFTDASEEELLALVRQGESDALEFKSTLRWNLKTNQPDKHVSLASIKTIAAFLNSEGGTLLIGVDDRGEVLGIDMQNFASEDKYLLHFNNLIKQHIGLEFVQHITFALKPVEGKNILVVDCRPSEEPVFVKQNGEEDFYVRVGPGSRKLPASKTLEYIKSRD